METPVEVKEPAIETKAPEIDWVSLKDIYDGLGINDSVFREFKNKFEKEMGVE